MSAEERASVALDELGRIYRKLEAQFAPHTVSFHSGGAVFYPRPRLSFILKTVWLWLKKKR